MAEEWFEGRLGDFIELKRGYDLPKATRIDGDVQVVSSSGPSGVHNHAKVKGPGVVTGRYGTIGQVFFVAEDFWPLNTTLYVRDFKGNDPRFISYFLRGLDFSAYSDKAAVPGINRNDLHEALVRVPDLPTQKNIERVLSTLDSKIELNQQMNKTLEAMALTVFRDWFVDFGPTHRKAEGATDPVAILGGLLPEPAKAAAFAELFPNRFGDNGLPEGWKLERVDQYLELAYGKALTKKDRIEGDYPVYGSGGVNGTHNTPLAKGPAIIVGRKGTVGSIYWEDKDFFAIDTVFYVVPRTRLSFLYYLLQTLGLDQMNTDAAVPGLNRNNVYRLERAFGCDATRDAFANMVDQFRISICNNEQESQILADTRDLLLPKLMSGEIRLKDAEVTS